LSARLRRAWKQTASAAARHSPDGPPDRLFLGPGVWRARTMLHSWPGARPQCVAAVPPTSMPRWSCGRLPGAATRHRSIAVRTSNSSWPILRLRYS